MRDRLGEHAGPEKGDLTGPNPVDRGKLWQLFQARCGSQLLGVGVLTQQADELLQELLTERFAEGDAYCRVGDDVHFMTDGLHEIRLTLLPGASAWHAEIARVEGWLSPEGGRIPDECRWPYTRYADRRYDTREGCLQEAHLREAAAKRGAAGVDALVRYHQAQLAAWYAALDEFIASVHTAEDLPGWAQRVVADELWDILQTRDFLTSAIMKYHHGDLAPRPDTALDKPSFELSTVTIKLAPPPAR